MRRCLAALLVLVCPLAASAQTAAGCRTFPADHVWNAPVDRLPVHPQSALWIDTIGRFTGLHADFGTVWAGAPNGIPWTDVAASQPEVAIVYTAYGDESDPGPWPVPPDAPVEGGASGSGDRHVLVVDRDACRLYELYRAFPQEGGAWWSADSGAAFDLAGYALRPDGWTSADAAGLPILPGLVRHEEAVASGDIRHALRFTVPQTRNQHVWPARHHASPLSGAEYPPMGQRFRLRADFDTSGFSPEVRVILRALKRYGMILADNGSAWYVSGAPNTDWDDDALAELGQVLGSNFEAVDSSSLMLDPDSARTAIIFADDLEGGSTAAWQATVP